MRILIYGAGGMGLYMSARLAQTDHEVTLKARGRALEQARRGTPITLTADGGTQTVHGVHALADPAATGPYDLIILSTKAWQVGEAAADVAGLLAENGRVLIAQNGVDAPNEAAEHLPAESVLAAAAVVVVERTGPLAVKLTGPEGSLTIGAPQRAEADEHDQTVVSSLIRAGMLTQWNEDISTVLWKNLALVASYGGVGALTGAPVGVNRAVPQTKALITNAMREAFTVGNAQGAQLTDEDFEDIVAAFTQKFTEDTTVSLQRDLIDGRPSELREQVGAIITHARRTGVDAPIFETIYASQLPRELQARAATEAR